MLGVLSFTLHADLQWALRDLDFIKSCIAENHPGIYNVLDSAFCSSLELFVTQARDCLQHAISDGECAQILSDFGKKFHDAHLVVHVAQLPTVSMTSYGTRDPFSSEFIAEGVCAIRIPTFAPQEAERAGMRTIIEHMPLLNTACYIVFDVRGNTGGNSAWGTQIVDGLFGASYAQCKRKQALEQQYVEWRASASNIAYLEECCVPHIQAEFGHGSKEMHLLEKVIAGMRAAYKEGAPYYGEHANDTHNINPEISRSYYNGTVIVLIDRRCGSACLDFIDELKYMDVPIALIGEQTAADSLYMEQRAFQLPSGKGTLYMPIKVYRNRLRGHNEPYVPDVSYSNCLPLQIIDCINQSLIA